MESFPVINGQSRLFVRVSLRKHPVCCGEQVGGGIGARGASASASASAASTRGGAVCTIRRNIGAYTARYDTARINGPLHGSVVAGTEHNRWFLRWRASREKLRESMCTNIYLKDAWLATQWHGSACGTAAAALADHVLRHDEHFDDPRVHGPWRQGYFTGTAVGGRRRSRQLAETWCSACVHLV